MNQLTFLGDVWLPRPFQCTAVLPGDFIFNLESPITGADCAVAGKICLKADSSFIAKTFGRCPVAVCLANNHIMDYGPEGFSDTLAVLRKEGIRYFGAGTLEENCNNPLVLEMGGHRIGVVGYVCASANPVFAQDALPGVLPLKLSGIEKDVKALRSRGIERVVVMLHWGIEQVHLPRPEDVKTAMAIAEFGADLVVGHHSHTVQPIQIHKGKTICYGLGNCIFPFIEAPVITNSGRRTFRYRQRSWNQRSLAVTVGSDFLHPTVQTLRFRDGVLRPAKATLNLLEVSKLPSDLPICQYEQRFTRHARMCALRPAVTRFLEKPRFPRWRHFAEILRVARMTFDC